MRNEFNKTIISKTDEYDGTDVAVLEISTEVDIVPTDEVKAPVIEKERFRKDLGDLTDLKKSIKEIGQIHPIVIDTKRKLIAGARRLQACIELGIDPVYRSVDFNNPLKAEIDENVVRKDFTPSEIFEINKYYNKELSKQGNRTDINFGTNDTEVKKHPRDIVSNITDVGTMTLSKINKIYNSDNEEVKKKVDKGKLSIDKGYQEVKKAESSGNDLQPDELPESELKKVIILDKNGKQVLTDEEILKLAKIARNKVQKLLSEIHPSL